MAMTKLRGARRLGFAGLTAAVAFSGVGFGLTTPAFADDATSTVTTQATGPRTTGKFVIHSTGRDAGYLALNGLVYAGQGLQLTGHGTNLAGAQNAAITATFPAPGTSGPIIRDNGTCIVYGAVAFQTCDGCDAQKWNLSKDGTLDTGANREITIQGAGRAYLGFGGSGGLFKLDMSDKLILLSASVQSIDLHARTANLIGGAVPGSVVILNGTIEVTVGDDGTWSHTITGLKLGKNTITVEQYEGENNKTDETTVDVDLDVAAISATASFLPDVTQNLMITGVAQAGANVEIWQGDRMIKTVPAAEITGHFSADVTAPNAGGTQTYTIKQVIDGETAADTFEVTANYGAAASIVTPVADQVHNGGALQFQGRGVTGGLIELREQGKQGVIGTATVLANGVWTINAANILPKKATYVATQTGRGNNVTTASVQLNPDAGQESLEITTPAQDATVAQGKVTFTGKSNPGADIRIESNITSALLGTGKADDNGNWSIEINRNLVAGSYNFRVMNGGLVENRQFRVAADTLTVTTPAQNGVVAPGKVTFTGTANPDAKIRIVSNVTGSLLGEGTANASGAWSIEINRNLVPDTYNFRVMNGAASVERQFRTVSDTLSVATPTENGVVAPGEVTFTGTANPNAKIRIVSNVTSSLLGEGVANESGAWSIKINRNLVADTYNFRVVNGSASVDRKFRVSSNMLTVTSPTEGGTVAAGKVTFTGTANPGAAVKIESNVTSSLLGQGVADGSGAWEIEITRPLIADGYNFRVVTGDITVNRQFRVA